MTPDANETPAESPENGAAWLSVAEAAAAMGVSEKTVWRRAKAGEITARKVAGARGGFVWEVAPDSSGQPTGQTDRPDTKPTGQNKAQKRAAPVIHAQTDRTSRADKTDRPTGQPTGHGDEMAARLLAQLETENAFLRGVVEQLQRDGAETRAALRKALDNGQPKQLTSGAASGELEQVGTDTRAPGAPISSDKPRGVVTPGAASNEAQNGEVSSYGALADWLDEHV
jgi:hypothetical protein